MQPIKEVVLEKTYDAPIEKVWQAWTQPEMLKHWWGPDNVTIPKCEINLGIPGKFYIVMQARKEMGSYAGVSWPMLAEFTEIIPNKKIAYRAEAWVDGDKDETTINQTTEINFAKEEGENAKTKVTIKAAIYKTGPKAVMAIDGMQMGFTQQLEKLNKFLTFNF